MEKSIVFQGKRLYYDKTGAGPTLVFLHGFLENRSIWESFTRLLTKAFTCISVDLPGFGKSENRSQIHTMEFMAEAVKAVMNEEKITDAVVTGHSMGGYVALSFAEKYPYALKGLVLFHSHAAADDQEAKNNRNRTIEVVKNEKQHFISSFIPLLFAEQNVEKFGNEITRLRQESLKASAEGIIAALAGMRDRKESGTVLQNLQVPVFFVVGKQDSRIPVEKIAPYLTLPKHSESLILDGVGHMGFIEAPGTIFPVLTDFYHRCFHNR